MSSEYIGLGALQPSEKSWRDRYMFLKEHGYILRPRYHPDWVPSWITAGKPLYRFEDSIMTLESDVIDAMQVDQNYRVSIKVVSRATDEIKIACLLSARESFNDPNNHCVPILDVLPDPLLAGQALLVMPYLRPFDDPPFEAVEEIMDFVKQTLEGLCFIHSKGVAHRLRPTSEPHATSGQYYYIDFGMSSCFEEGESPYVLGAKGADQHVPELSNVHPYNAFMLDLYILGHLYRVVFMRIYLDFDFLEPLVSAMTQEQPERRPTAEAALRMFHDIRRSLNTTQLHWRLRKRDESGAERVVYDTISAAKVGFGLVRRSLMG